MTGRQKILCNLNIVLVPAPRILLQSNQSHIQHCLYRYMCEENSLILKIIHSIFISPFQRFHVTYNTN